MERTLTLELAGPQHQEGYRRFAESCSLLSSFPSASDLIEHLHGSRNASDGVHASDRILAELMRASAQDPAAAPLRDLLLLAFLPALHATLRRVALSYPTLANDDIAQHAVASLLETLRAPEFYERSSHVAFAIARGLRRNTFEWAERERRSPVYGANWDALPESMLGHDPAEPIERSALLRHFLHRCHERGLLTDEDLELLAQFKLDATRDQTNGGLALTYSNASRQRMKRLLSKLRRIARSAPGSKRDPIQLRLF
jgi:hypothetical protein